VIEVGLLRCGQNLWKFAHSAG